MAMKVNEQSSTEAEVEERTKVSAQVVLMRRPPTSLQVRSATVVSSCEKAQRWNVLKSIYYLTHTTGQ